MNQETMKRVGKRLQFQLPVWMGGRSADQQNHRAWTANVSLEGVFVETSETGAIGDEIQLEIGLPNAWVQVRGVIRWARQAAEATRELAPGFGLHLMDAPRNWYEFLLSHQ